MKATSELLDVLFQELYNITRFPDYHVAFYVRNDEKLYFTYSLLHSTIEQHNDSVELCSECFHTVRYWPNFEIHYLDSDLKICVLKNFQEGLRHHRLYFDRAIPTELINEWCYYRWVPYIKKEVSPEDQITKEDYRFVTIYEEEEY